MCNYRTFATHLRDYGEKSAGTGVAIADVDAVVVLRLLGGGGGCGAVAIGVVVDDVVIRAGIS